MLKDEIEKKITIIQKENLEIKIMRIKIEMQNKSDL
jgi:hypothetical protein